MKTTLDTFIRDYAQQLTGASADQLCSAIDLCRQRLNDVLEYHREQFVKAGFPLLADEQLLNHLRQGQFSAGHREGYDLIADVILAALLESKIAGAAEAFEARYRPQLQKWAHRYAGNDGEIVDDFIADLLLPREKSGPRISTYRGQAPMDGWLRQVLISQANRRRTSFGQVVELQPENRTCRIDPADEYARQECTHKLTPAFKQMFHVLDEAHRTILQMAVVDGVEQKKIAALFGVPDYKITRMKQHATEQVATAFFGYATREGMSSQSVRDCLKLIMDRFADSGMGKLLNLERNIS